MVAALARHANIELLPEYKYVISLIKWLASFCSDGQRLTKPYNKHVTALYLSLF